MYFRTCDNSIDSFDKLSDYAIRLSIKNLVLYIYLKNCYKNSPASVV